ncbi:MAG TPA: methyltransferase domain-containing protein [Acidimicrobiales bacterium]|nr:methyltransferase domain-containing protein [Acidimicrobiales bacterium]
MSGGETARHRRVRAAEAAARQASKLGKIASHWGRLGTRHWHRAKRHAVSPESPSRSRRGVVGTHGGSRTSQINEAGIGERIEVTQGDLQNLDLPSESFDTVLSTYTLCTIPSPQAALTEAWRVLRPGGRLILVEHGPAARHWVRAGQRLINPLSIRFQADHILRDPVPLALDAGFEIVDSDQTGWSGLVYRVITSKPQGA